MLKLATAFSGIGAIEHALDRMGVRYKIVFACDSDRFVKESFLANYDISESRWFDTVLDIDGKLFRGKVDLLVAGTPCQSFSMVGKRKGLKDKRGSLFHEFIRLIDEMKPKAFIFENVKGLLSHNSGKSWKVIESAFNEVKYSFFPAVLNSRDYGIPQNRERLFVVGFLEKRDFKFPDPVELKLTMQDLLEDSPGSKYYLREKGTRFVTSPKNLRKRYTQINGRVALCQKANQQFNWHGDFVFEPAGKVPKKYFLSKKVTDYVLSPGTKKFYSRPETDLRIARPLLATMAKMHRAGIDNYVTRRGRIRKLAPRECLRLMGFDDTFKIVVSDTQMYRQAGNSIAVDVLIHILRSMGIRKNSRVRL